VSDNKAVRFRSTRVISLISAAVFTLYAAWALYDGKFWLLPWAKKPVALEGMAALLASMSLLTLSVFIVLILFEWKYNKLRELLGYLAFFSFILSAILSAFY